MVCLTVMPSSVWSVRKVTSWRRCSRGKIPAHVIPEAGAKPCFRAWLSQRSLLKLGGCRQTLTDPGRSLEDRPSCVAASRACSRLRGVRRAPRSAVQIGEAGNTTSHAGLRRFGWWHMPTMRHPPRVTRGSGSLSCVLGREEHRREAREIGARSLRNHWISLRYRARTA